MSATLDHTSSEDARVILNTLKAAVTHALERKRQLGQYAVIWKNGKPTQVGLDKSNLK